MGVAVCESMADGLQVLGVHEGNPPTLQVSWPPSRVKGRRLVSLDTESPRLCAPVRLESAMGMDPGVNVIIPQDAPHLRGLHVWIQWPEPFTELFPPTGGGGDVLYHHQVVM